MMWMGHVLNHVPDHVLDHMIIGLVTTAFHLLYLMKAHLREINQYSRI